MTEGEHEDLSNLSMLELFQSEAENQAAIITGGLLELEKGPATMEQLEALMRAAHSLKGAARIVNQGDAVNIAHALEDCFVAAQRGQVQLQQAVIDVLFEGVDLVLNIATHSESELPGWREENAARIRTFISGTASITTVETLLKTQPGFSPPAAASAPPDLTPVKLKSGPLAVSRKGDSQDRVLRLTAENVNRLLGLAGESLVESRWLHPFADSMMRLKRLQSNVIESLHHLRDSLETCEVSERVQDQMHETIEMVQECRRFLADRMVDLEMYDRRSANLSHRLYLEVLQCRMRPFGDGIRRLPRMVRDLANSLGKKVRLEVVGENTQVDRDILEKLESPLAHLLRNAIDHGCERPEERRVAGKPEECTIHLEARHSAGMLMIIVSDDGVGVHAETLRQTILNKKLTANSVVEKLTEAELLEFLLLPGFTMRDKVTEISGRGVGLDVVHNMVKSVRGSIRIFSNPGKGMRFQLHLPLTLSVLRTLLVEVGNEPFAIPLSQINRTLKLSKDSIETLEGRHHFSFGGQSIGLLTAHQVLEYSQPELHGDDLSIVVLGDRSARYGLVVDRLLGERELVVQPLDPRLGKIKDISSGALTEDGSPVLIVDVDDMLRSIEKLVSAGQLERVRRQPGELPPARKIKRILAVDDSLTVRELERKLLSAHGYHTDVAVDGMDAWNAVRSGNYDLIITDVDMPRMDGVELASLIKNDARFNSVPVLIVSYKDREEDRMRGLEAGADYYLTKGSFHDETLVQAVVDLIGEADL
jgi:two-component system sensor histidine kinase and response regulator WspE